MLGTADPREAEPLEPLAASPDERSNWEVLSLLRFVLALIVAATHADSGRHESWIAQFGSFEAILGFLVISGYAIGSSIQREPDGFFRRRMLRIYPVYLVSILLTWLVQRDPINAAFAWTLLVNLLFLGQIVVNTSYVGGAWTLGLEVWCYASAPLLLRLKDSTLRRLIGLSFVCYVVQRSGFTLFHWPYYAWTIGGINIPCLAFAWIAGFYLVAAAPRNVRMPALVFAGHFALALTMQIGHRLKHGELGELLHTDSVTFLCRGLLLVAICLTFKGVLSHRFRLTVWQRRVCRFLGDISYPLYLTHIAVLDYVKDYTQNSVLMLIAALLTATIVYASCDFYSHRRKLT